MDKITLIEAWLVENSYNYGRNFDHFYIYKNLKPVAIIFEALDKIYVNKYDHDYKILDIEHPNFFKHLEEYLGA